MNDNDYLMFLHIDDIREKKGISIGDFVEGVCERRQYSRYLNRSSKMSHKNLLGFLDKLNLSLISFYFSFYQSDMTEYITVVKIYEAITRRDMEYAKEKILEFDTHKFQDRQTERFFEFCCIYFNYLTKKVPVQHTHDKLSTLIGYPESISLDAYTYMDVIALKVIAKIEHINKEYQALGMLRGILSEDRVGRVFNEKQKLLPSVYVTVSNIYGMRGEIETSLEIAERGVKFCLLYGSNTLLHSLYYNMYLGNYKLGNRDVAEKYIIKTIHTCNAFRGDASVQKYKKIIEKDMGEEIAPILAKFKV